MLMLGWLPAAAIVIMAGASLAIGHLLSGPRQEQRPVLAIASIACNVDLALFIADLSDYGQQFLPTLLTYYNPEERSWSFLTRSGANAR